MHFYYLKLLSDATPKNYDFEKLQTRDLCEPQNFHAVSRSKKEKPLAKAVTTTGGFVDQNAHYSFLHIVISMLFCAFVQ